MMELETATQVIDGYRPTSAAGYRAAFLQHLALYGRKERPQVTPLKAGIDCGRWVVDCECGGGIALHPDWQIAACFLCGKSWSKVEFPSKEFMKQIDEILSMRPPGSVRKDPKRFYSWWPEETIKDLIAENQKHGWPVPVWALIPDIGGDLPIIINTEER